MSPAMSTPAFFARRTYWWLEARRAFGPRTAFALAAGVALLAATQAAIPALPATATGLLERAFDLRGTASLLLLNDHLALYVTLALFAQVELARVVVGPMEERQLALLLSKPVGVTEFFVARAAPVLAAQVALGAALTLGERLLVADALATSTQVTAAGVVAGGAIATALAVAVAALSLALQVLVGERELGLLVGVVFTFAPLLGSAVLVYRPDVYEGRPWARLLTTFPASLCAHDASLAAAAPWLVLGAAGLSALALALAARAFVARDLV